MHQQTDPTGDAATSALLRQIRAACLERGWDDGELARRAGVSRTTLYYLRRGVTRRPRAATLKRIAGALDIEPANLSAPAIASDHSESFGDLAEEGRRRFDRRTNPLIDVVRQDKGELFQRWTADEWDELYSLVGTGGALSEEGVAREAARINRRRETVRRLQVVMETHLADVAERMVETLFEMTRPQGGTPGSARLLETLPHHRADAQEQGAGR